VFLQRERERVGRGEKGLGFVEEVLGRSFYGNSLTYS